MCTMGAFINEVTSIPPTSHAHNGCFHQWGHIYTSNITCAQWVLSSMRSHLYLQHHMRTMGAFINEVTSIPMCRMGAFINEVNLYQRPFIQLVWALHSLIRWIISLQCTILHWTKLCNQPVYKHCWQQATYIKLYPHPHCYHTQTHAQLHPYTSTLTPTHTHPHKFTHARLHPMVSCVTKKTSFRNLGTVINLCIQHNNLYD